jgi:hypothetical protein
MSAVRALALGSCLLLAMDSGAYLAHASVKQSRKRPNRKRTANTETEAPSSQAKVGPSPAASRSSSKSKVSQKEQAKEAKKQARDLWRSKTILSPENEIFKLHGAGVASYFCFVNHVTKALLFPSALAGLLALRRRVFSIWVSQFLTAGRPFFPELAVLSDWDEFGFGVASARRIPVNFLFLQL